MILAASVFSGCDEFLDLLPDDRAEVNTADKVAKLLTSAYPDCNNNFLMEMSSDNVDDVQYYLAIDVESTREQEEVFRFKMVTSEDWDTPYWIWNYYYKAVATANEALASIERMGDGEELQGVKAEALLCRAYGMFQLGVAFCMAYDPDKADQYLGLYYPKQVSSELNPLHQRGTLKEFYENLNADIEAAVGGDTPMLNEAHMQVPKYHFNMKAAYAFAARFNLYYQNWEAAAKYATKVLGDNPKPILRDMSLYNSAATGAEDIFNMYIRSSNSCNLMIQNSYSLWGRSYSTGYNRFNHNQLIENNETFGAKTPFGRSSGSLFYWNNMLYYQGNQAACTFFPKMLEKFEYTDKTASTGSPHVVDVVFSTDETLMVRAEAYTHMGMYDEACDDLNAWAETHTKAKANINVRPVFTPEYVNEWMTNEVEYTPVTPELSERSIKKILHPQGFTVEEGVQESLIQLILHLRRLETWRQGMRFYDLKRYGIEYTHFIEDEDPIVFKAGDLRGAIQLPDAVIQAGVTPNPREDEANNEEK